MFNLFRKRRKVADWELALLRNVIKQLPAKFEGLNAQITQGLFAASRKIRNDSENEHVSFSFNPSLINEFENRKARNYQIKGIKLYDRLAQNGLNFTLYVYSGVISGYLIEGTKFDIDLNKIDAAHFKQIYNDNRDAKKLNKLLSADETKLINPDEVYEVVLNDKIYFHIQDLGDGDFIGIGMDKVVYEITHDPFEIKPIGKSLKEFFTEARI
jgi:hypothetical protein